jgi:hypothetical protein
MRVPFFDAHLPDESADVMDHHHEPSSAVEVACLSTIALCLDPNVDKVTLDGHISKVLDALAEQGLSVVAVESAGGDRVHASVYGAESERVVRERRLCVVGVDLLDQADRQGAIRQEAQCLKGQHRALFDALRARMLAVAKGWPDAAFARYVRECSTLASEEGLAILSRRLLALEQDFESPYPPKIRRVLMSIAREGEIDQGAFDAEKRELAERINRHTERGLLDPGMMRRFRHRLPGSPHAAKGSIATTSLYNPRILSAAEVEALNICSTAVDALKIGAVAMSMEEVITSGYSAEARLYGYNTASDQILSVSRSLSYLFDVALILGIDSYCYPMLHRVHQQHQALRELADEDFLTRVLANFERAHWHARQELAHEAEQREFLDLIPVLDRLNKLAQLEVHPEDFEELNAEFDDYTLASVVDYLASRQNRMDSSGRSNEVDQTLDFLDLNCDLLGARVGVDLEPPRGTRPPSTGLRLPSSPYSSAKSLARTTLPPPRFAANS